MGKLTPDVIDGENRILDVEALESVNKLGKIDLLAHAPNSERDPSWRHLSHQRLPSRYSLCDGRIPCVADIERAPAMPHF